MTSHKVSKMVPLLHLADRLNMLGMRRVAAGSVTSKKSPNVYKSRPKMISLRKMKDFDTFTKID